MTDKHHYDRLLDQDWGDAWDSLPSAPPLVPTQPKSAQITLRLPHRMVASLREVAERKTLPYHALARSWLVDGLRERQIPSGAEEVAGVGESGDTQLNLKMAPELLTELKRFSNEIRIPYHRLARLWIDAGLRHELAASTPSSPPKNLTGRVDDSPA